MISGYTGQAFDEATGLAYHNARYYDPKTGRFISEDPIGFGDGYNLYRYAGNNPVNAIDPSGLSKVPTTLGGFGAYTNVSQYSGLGSFGQSYIGGGSSIDATPRIDFGSGSYSNVPSLLATKTSYVSPSYTPTFTPSVATMGIGNNPFSMDSVYAMRAPMYEQNSNMLAMAGAQGGLLPKSLDTPVMEAYRTREWLRDITNNTVAGAAVSTILPTPFSLAEGYYSDRIGDRASADAAYRSAAIDVTAGAIFGAAFSRPASATTRSVSTFTSKVDNVGSFGYSSGTGAISISSTRANVLSNIADSQGARASSKFTEFDRRAVARQFYSDSGFSGGRLESHLQGIDFAKPVAVRTISQGHYVEQWVKGGKVGSYFSPIGQPPELNGISRGMRTPIAFQANQDVKVLQSYAAPITDTWTLGPNYPVTTPGGGIQYFVPNQSAFDIIFGW